MEPHNLPSNDTELGADALNLRHYWHVILERRWLVITAFVSVFVLCLIYLFKATPIFMSTTQMRIDREGDNVLNIRDAFSFDGREQDYLQTQYKELKSRTLVETVIQDLNLKEDPRYAEKRDKAKAVLMDITVAPIRLSRLVDIKAEHTDPNKAALIANTLATNFMNRNLQRKLTKMLESLEYLKQEAGRLEKDVEKADQALETYRRENKMVSLEESENIVQQGLRQAQEVHDKARTRAVATQNVVDEVEAMLKEQRPIDTIPQVTQDKLIQDLKKTLSEQQAQLDGLLKKYRSRHPEVIRAREVIASLQKDIQQQSQKVIESFRNEARMAKTEEDIQRAELDKRVQESLALGQLRVKYGVLSREALKNKTLFDLVLSRVKETDIMGKDRTQNMRIVDPAIPDLKPVKPRWLLTIFLGVLGGAAVAVGLAFFVNYLDDSIKSQDDVETYLKLPFLGYIPNIKTNSVVERDLQAHVHPQSNSAEGFRTVRAAISLSPKSEKYHVLAVTSTIPSEGKSLVASNLAIVTAQTGLKTLLVDADLRRPSVHKSFQLQSPVGLSSYLTEKVNSVDEFTHTSEISNLDVICCGAVPSSPSELLGSKRMAQFVLEVRQRYERIILDCPPVSAVSDPLLAASLSDGVVFVTKFNKIRREHARRSVQRIQDAGIHILGVVLNDIDFEGKDSYYYSYYYYQNRYYASHYKTDKKEKSADLQKS